MSSGLKSMVINTAERAISTDINRLQSFQTKGLMEASRYLMDVLYSNQGIVGADGASLNNADDVGAASMGLEQITTGTPLAGEIIGGLCVVPQVGTLGLGITPGVLFCISPDVAQTSDDSVYKYVQDPGGLPLVTGLTMTANVGGTPRIDVIECQPQPNPHPETDNRDVFNPTTALFTASTVQKSAGDTMLYRVRLGTGGAGFPGVVSGWLPLAVALVPASTSTNDAMTFWDVRPLVSDRIFGVSNVDRDMPYPTLLTFSALGGVADTDMVGGIAEVQFGNARAGGRIQRGSPGVDYTQPYCDFFDPSNQEAGLSLAPVTTALIFYYLCFPFGLPRWARYTDYQDLRGRVPRNPRGIPMLSKVPPVHVYATNSAAIVFPAVFGFNGAACAIGDAVCFGAATYQGGFINQMSCARGITDIQSPMAPVFDTYVGGPRYTGNMTLTENVHWPAGASRLRGTLTLPLQLNGGSVITSGDQAQFTVSPNIVIQILGVTNSQVSQYYPDNKQFSIVPGVNQGVNAIWFWELNLPNQYPATPTALQYEFIYEFVLAGGAPATPSANVSLTITGWEFGQG